METKNNKKIEILVKSNIAVRNTERVYFVVKGKTKYCRNKSHYCILLEVLKLQFVHISFTC